METENFIALNKPFGIAVHSGTKSEKNIISLIKNKEYEYIELCHRLDKNTSGCMILAKNKDFLSKFNKLISEKKIIKEYHAIIKGSLDKNAITIKTKNKLNLYNSKINDEDKYSESIIKNITIYKNASLIKITPITGRLHQIRIHLTHIGYPIANDEKYGNKTFNNEIKKYGISRMILHSKTIKFTCPITQKKITIHSEYDCEIKKLIKNLKEITNAK
ncbi:MAG TPA: RluA family pseudouridine synthase [Candidatus Azoamicus sp.]